MKTDSFTRLEGAPNFRDFGGYKTRSGKKILTGKLLRSDALDCLNENDQHLLQATGLKSIIDLREPTERSQRPHNLGPTSTASILSFPVTGDLRLDQASLLDKIMENPTAEGCFDAMLHAYSVIAELIGKHLPDIFDLLLDTNKAPLLIHCAAGKDRTGVLCALIHYALDIPDDAIMYDYLLTNTYCPPEAYSSLFTEKIKNKTGHALSDVALLPIKQVDTRYLLKTFETITENYGSIDVYLKDVAKLNSEKREQLKRIFTEA